MIFRFVLDSEIFAEARQDPNDDAVWEQHERFLKSWLRYGVLVQDDESQQQLNQEINSLPDTDLKKLWQGMLRSENRFRKLKVPQVCELPIWRAEVAKDVTVMHSTVETLFVDKRKKTKLAQNWPHDTEVCSFQAPGRSACLKRVQELDEHGIKKGMTREKLWESHFQPIAEVSDQIVIVDRFVVHRWLRLGGERGLQPELDFLLLRLAQNPKPCTVQIYSAAIFLNSGISNPNIPRQPFRDMREDRFKQVIKQLRDFELGSIRKLTIRLLHSNDFRDDAHFRFIRFNDLYVSTDNGIGVFAITDDNPTVSSATLHRYDSPRNVCKNAENELSQKSVKPWCKCTFSKR